MHKKNTLTQASIKSLFLGWITTGKVEDGTQSMTFIVIILSVRVNV